MSTRLNLDYFYGIQADQFEYFKIPKLLITDKRYNGISSDAKILYGVLLDRMSLSLKHRWLDNQNRVFIIYSIKEICEKLECSKDKAMYVMAELDSVKGIGLIEKVKRGFGLPDIIYVKNFATLENKDSVKPAKKVKAPVKKNTKGNKTDTYGCQVRYDKVGNREIAESQYQEVEDIQHPAVGNIPPLEMANNRLQEVAEFQPQEVADFRLQEVAEFQPQEVADLRPQEVAEFQPQRWQISDPSNNNINNNNINNLFPSIPFKDEKEEKGKDSSTPIILTMEKRDKSTGHARTVNSQSVTVTQKEKYVQFLKKRLYYNDLPYMAGYKENMDTIDGIINMIADVASSVPKDNKEWINSRAYEHEAVKSHLLKLDLHSLYVVLSCLNNNTTNIRSHRNYLLTAVYNAIDNHDFVLNSKVAYDMYGGGPLTNYQSKPEDGNET